MSMNIIARIHNDFPSKFGIPRQSGRVPSLRAQIVFEPEYRNRDALRGLEDYSHIWLIWEFSESAGHDWTPTVRPPRLGGNKRMGVFATRSPFRPNPIGLSCVRLEAIRLDGENGPVLEISGADLMDGTPIYDIKPYLPSADCHPDALGGFAAAVDGHRLQVEFPADLLEKVPEKSRQALCDVLAEDPRPGYQEDPQRIYGMRFGKQDIRFRVEQGVLTVCEVASVLTQ